MSRSSRPATQAAGSPGCKPAGPLLGQASRSAPLRRSHSASVPPDLDATPGRPQPRSCQRLALRKARIFLTGTRSALLRDPWPRERAAVEQKDPDQGSAPLSPPGNRPRGSAGPQRPSAACLPRQPPPTFMNSSLSKQRFSGPRGRFIFFASMTGPAPACLSQRGTGGTGQSVRERRSGLPPPRQRPLEGSERPCKRPWAGRAAGTRRWRGACGGVCLLTCGAPAFTGEPPRPASSEAALWFLPRREAKGAEPCR